MLGSLCGLGERKAAYSLSRRLASSHQPHSRARPALEKSPGRGKVVGIDLEFAGLEGHGDVFASILRPQGRVNESVVDLLGAAFFLSEANIGCSSERRPSRPRKDEIVTTFLAVRFTLGWPSSSSDLGQYANFAFQSLAQPVFLNFEIESTLQIQPKPFRSTEVAGKP